MNASFSAFAVMVMPLLALDQTGVTFQTKDADMPRLFDAAEVMAAANIVRFTPSLKVLVEGGGYGNVWIETRPMVGEMYAKRDPEVALMNQPALLRCASFPDRKD